MPFQKRYRVFSGIHPPSNALRGNSGMDALRPVTHSKLELLHNTFPSWSRRGGIGNERGGELGNEWGEEVGNKRPFVPSATMGLVKAVSI